MPVNQPCRASSLVTCVPSDFLRAGGSRVQRNQGPGPKAKQGEERGRRASCLVTFTSLVPDLR